MNLGVQRPLEDLVFGFGGFWGFSGCGVSGLRGFRVLGLRV